MKNIFRYIFFMGIMLFACLLMGCGFSTELVQKDDTADYDTSSFEQALNDGIDVMGSFVVFEVLSYESDSTFGNCCSAGEHLIFISEEELDIKSGDIVRGKVTEKPSKYLDSWMIPYIAMSIEKGEEAPVPEKSSSVDRDHIDMDAISTPISNYDCEGKNYKEIEKLFKNAGFTNVSLLGYELLENDTGRTEGEVISVYAGEKDCFDQGEMLDKNVEIVIGYAIIIKTDGTENSFTDAMGETASNNSENIATDKKEEIQKGNNTSTEDDKLQYNIWDYSAVMYATTSINVRSIPDISGDRLGSLAKNESVEVTGKVDNGWYRINYNGTGFVLGDYLSTEKAVIVPVIVSPSSSDNPGNGDRNSDPSVIVPTQPDTEGDLVWIPTKGGTKYHSRANCSGMKDPIQVTREHAEANGYTPCKKCH